MYMSGITLKSQRMTFVEQNMQLTFKSINKEICIFLQNYSKFAYVKLIKFYKLIFTFFFFSF